MMDNFWQNENTMTHFNLDVSETEDAYLVEAEMPGVKKKTLIWMSMMMS